MKKKELEDRASQNGVWGPLPLIWMGVPLTIKDEVIGVVAVQSYLDTNLYNKKDLQVLSAVSDQMAIVIERKRAEEALIKKDKELENWTIIAAKELNYCLRTSQVQGSTQKSQRISKLPCG